MVWAVEYSDTAKAQLRKLDKQTARRIVDFMDKRVAHLPDPRCMGKALNGPLGAFWRYRVGDYRIIASLEDEVLRILVVRIGHRKEVYRR